MVLYFLIWTSETLKILSTNAPYIAKAYGLKSYFHDIA